MTSLHKLASIQVLTFQASQYFPTSMFNVAVMSQSKSSARETAGIFHVVGKILPCKSQNPGRHLENPQPSSNKNCLYSTYTNHESGILCFVSSVIGVIVYPLRPDTFASLLIWYIFTLSHLSLCFYFVHHRYKKYKKYIKNPDLHEFDEKDLIWDIYSSLLVFISLMMTFSLMVIIAIDMENNESGHWPFWKWIQVMLGLVNYVVWVMASFLLWLRLVEMDLARAKGGEVDLSPQVEEEVTKAGEQVDFKAIFGCSSSGD